MAMAPTVAAHSAATRPTRRSWTLSLKIRKRDAITARASNPATIIWLALRLLRRADLRRPGFVMVPGYLAVKGAPRIPSDLRRSPMSLMRRLVRGVGGGAAAVFQPQRRADEGERSDETHPRAGGVRDRGPEHRPLRKQVQQEAAPPARRRGTDERGRLGERRHSGGRDR